MDIKVTIITDNNIIDDNTNALNLSSHVIVATPFRVHDLAARRIADLSKCETIVMDEADKLLSTDFQEDVQFLVTTCKQYQLYFQICLFSARFSKKLLEYKKTHLPRGYLVQSMVPAGNCRFTKPELREMKLRYDELCPSCLKEQIVCDVTCHPTQEQGIFLLSTV